MSVKDNHLRRLTKPGRTHILFLSFFFIFSCSGSYCYARACSSCSEWELLFVARHGLPIAKASLVAGSRVRAQ